MILWLTLARLLSLQHITDYRNTVDVALRDKESWEQSSCDSEMISLLLAVLLLPAEAARFELFQLPVNSAPHPQPYCNDGSQAGYYHDTDYTKLGKVHVHLQGGNLCDSDQEQTDPLSLVEVQRGSALIGRELQSVACAKNFMP